MATVFMEEWDARETLKREILEELLEDYLRRRPEEREDFLHESTNPDNYMLYIGEYMSESSHSSYCNCGAWGEELSISLRNRRGDTIITREARVCPECGARGGVYRSFSVS
jgi:hypothetical protein